jgi:hypothetical protein
MEEVMAVPPYQPVQQEAHNSEIEPVLGLRMRIRNRIRTSMFLASRFRIHLSEVRIRVRLRILPFSQRCVERTEKMPAK